MELLKGEHVTLRSLNLDEKWLQKQIWDDPTILGLGGLIPTQRECRQPTGGRIDCVMSNPNENIRYEIEVMLGPLDESHIIRAIEYWDIERTRYRNSEHRAVIIAEEITTRFYNVIWLLNRSIPMIAIQLQAIKVGDKALLNFTKVLDITDLTEEEDERPSDENQPGTRDAWEKLAKPHLMAIVDKMVKMVPGSPHVNYNRGHIAVGTSGFNFMWFMPRKNAWNVELRMDGTGQADWTTKLKEKGITADPLEDYIRMRLTSQEELTQSNGVMGELLTKCEELSRE